MKTKGKILGIMAIMLVFIAVRVSAQTIDMRFVDLEYPQDSITLRANGTCTVTIDGATARGTYTMSSNLVRGSTIQITFRLDDGSVNILTAGWGTQERRPWILVDGYIFEAERAL